MVRPLKRVGHWLVVPVAMLCACVSGAGAAAPGEGSTVQPATVTLQVPDALEAGPVMLQQIARVDHASPEVAARIGAVKVAMLERHAPDRQLRRLEVQRVVARALGA